MSWLPIFCLSTCPPIYLSMYLSIYLYIYLSIHPSITLNIGLFPLRSEVKIKNKGLGIEKLVYNPRTLENEIRRFWTQISLGCIERLYLKRKNSAEKKEPNNHEFTKNSKHLVFVCQSNIYKIKIFKNIFNIFKVEKIP